MFFVNKSPIQIFVNIESIAVIHVSVINRSCRPIRTIDGKKKREQIWGSYFVIEMVKLSYLGL